METIGNPKLGVPDFDEIARIAQEAHVPLIVDSTFTPPCIFKPIEHGADVVVHSLTKWIGGHGTGIGGVVVDAGRFDWTDSKFGLFAKPEPSYGGMRFGHDLGELQTMAFILQDAVGASEKSGSLHQPGQFMDVLCRVWRRFP